MSELAIAAAGFRSSPVSGGADRWLTLAEARRLLGFSELQLRHLADTGRVRSFRTMGGHRRFLARDICRIAAAHDRPVAADAPKMTSAWSARLLAAVAHRVIGAGGNGQTIARAYQTGMAFGATMRAADLTVGEATGAFVEFRRRIEQLASQILRRTACSDGDTEQTMARLSDLTDEILCGIAEAYESDASPSIAAI